MTEELILSSSEDLVFVALKRAPYLYGQGKTEEQAIQSLEMIIALYKFIESEAKIKITRENYPLETLLQELMNFETGYSFITSEIDDTIVLTREEAVEAEKAFHLMESPLGHNVLVSYSNTDDSNEVPIASVLIVCRYLGIPLPPQLFQNEETSMA